MSIPPEAARHRVLRHISFENSRQLAGGGLILAAAHLLSTVRGMVGKGGPTTVATVIQITFAACAASVGVAILAAPTENAQKKM